MIKFLMKLTIFACIAAASGFFAVEKFGKTRVTQEIAKAVTPVVALADLALDPAKYEGALIQVVGRPVPHARIAALGFGGLAIDDGNGHQLIILAKSGLPTADDTGMIKIVGVYRRLVEFGSNSYPVLVTD
jgi:hypothetical protein